MYKLGIVGAKNSGKTTLVEILLSKLTAKSVSVMSKKHTSHSHAFDTVGKDSERHRNAGSKVTVAVNPKEFAIFAEFDQSLLYKIEDAIADQFDICIVEGDKFSEIPKILLTRNVAEIDITKITNIIACYGNESLHDDLMLFNPESIDLMVEFIIDKLSIKKIKREKA